jgi:6-phosphogluconolactonase (cycloisomerase 2 family)
MKFRKLGRSLVAAAATLGVAVTLSSCGSNTVAYVYVLTSGSDPGQIAVYSVDSQSGALIRLQQSPFPSGGRYPVAAVVSASEKNLYVANQIDNTIVNFAIGADGKLYPQTTINTPGSFPTALAVSPDNKFLYVADKYAPGFSDSEPGPGALVVYPIDAKTGALGSPVNNTTPKTVLNYFPVGNQPKAIGVIGQAVKGSGSSSTLETASVLVVAVNPSPATNQSPGAIYSFTANLQANDGTLTASTLYPVGVNPSAIAVDPTFRFVYVTDFAQNQMYGYTIQSTGAALNSMVNSPFKTGNLPTAVTIDPRGVFLYLTNYGDSTISAYSLDSNTGIPTATAGNASASSTLATDTGPQCVVVEPSLGRYVYTANFLGNSVSAYKLNPNNGAIVNVQNSPFPVPSQPTCVTAITHGEHAVQALPPTGATNPVP